MAKSLLLDKVHVVRYWWLDILYSPGNFRWENEGFVEACLGRRFLMNILENLMAIFFSCARARARLVFNSNATYGQA